MTVRSKVIENQTINVFNLNNLPGMILGFRIGDIKEQSEDSLKNDIFINNVKTNEVLSEATIQLALNGMVMSEFGISDKIQVISAMLSMFSIFKCLVDRYAFIRLGKDNGLFSFEFYKAIFDLFPLLASLFMLELLAWSDDTVPPYVSFVLVFPLHTFWLGIQYLISTMCCGSKKCHGAWVFGPVELLIYMFYIYIYLTLIVSTISLTPLNAIYKLITVYITSSYMLCSTSTYQRRY